MDPLNELAVIVPVSRDETAWRHLMRDLKRLPAGTEILFVGDGSPCLDFESYCEDHHYKGRLRWVSSCQDRGVQLNTGAKATKKKFLWFLHADSRMSKKTIPCLQEALSEEPDALHYFILHFLSDGPPLMRINEIGCWVRSRLMGVPFGDQGFCLSRDNFKKIGGFPEKVAYGEDHLFVWYARQKKIRLNCTGAVLKTSARRYAETGWGRLTWRYAHRWVRQAVPEWIQWR